MDADRLARLLDRIGPAIMVTHSASGPDGWLVADRRPDLVKAIVSIEPMGPPVRPYGRLLTTGMGGDSGARHLRPAARHAQEVRAADGASLRMPALAGLPVVVVTGETSLFVKLAPAIVEFLATAGADAEHLHLPDQGVRGNGHGLIYEKNSDQTLAPVLRWLAARTSGTRAETAEKAA